MKQLADHGESHAGVQQIVLMVDLIGGIGFHPLPLETGVGVLQVKEGAG